MRRLLPSMLSTAAVLLATACSTSFLPVPDGGRPPDPDAGRPDDDGGPPDGGPPDGGPPDAGDPTEPACARALEGFDVLRSPLDATPLAILADPDEGLYIAGLYSDEIEGGAFREIARDRSDGFVAALSLDGAVRWLRGIRGDRGQAALRLALVGDTLVVGGTTGGETDFEVDGPAGPMPPLTPSGYASFLLGLDREDGTSRFATLVEASVVALVGGETLHVAVHTLPGIEDLGCPVAGLAPVLLARLDVDALIEDPDTGALAPTCTAGRLFEGLGPTALDVDDEGRLYLGGAAFEGGTFGGAPIPFPDGAEPGAEAAFVARLDPAFDVDWVRGFVTHPQPTISHPSHLFLDHLDVLGDRVLVGGRLLGAADFGGGLRVGTPGGADFELALVALGREDGAFALDRVFVQAGGDGVAGSVLDEAGQIHVAGRFSGPGYDLSDGDAPLLGTGQAYVGTLLGDGSHHCSFASEGGGNFTRTVQDAALTPDRSELLLVGSMIGTIDFGSGPIGEAGSTLRRVYLQRVALRE